MTEKSKKNESDILKELSDAIGRNCIRQLHEVLTGRFDAYIEYEDTILAAIIIRDKIYVDLNDLLTRCLAIKVSNLIIIENHNEIQLIELSLSGYKTISMTWRDLVDFCKKLINSFVRAPKNIAESLVNWINKKCVHIEDFSVSKNDLCISATEVMFSEAKEREFFNALLGGKRIRRVCRFTNLDSAKICVDEKKQNMLSIVCMNDKSECYYADNFINPGAKAIEWYNKTASEVGATIESYILSLSYESMSDNLTMWRLYGNDAKGVSMIYECPENMPDGFYLAPVNYATSKTAHPKLTFIKKLTAGIYGYHIKFRHWNVWKHFFKPKEYDIEKEIRIVFINKDYEENKTTYEKKWIISKNNSILSPMIIFPLYPKKNAIEFPLTLRKIIIGSKCPEINVNKASLQALAIERFGNDPFNEPNIKIGISNINSYRD